MKRIKGWYWVKFKSDEEPKWEVALWNGDFWEQSGYEWDYRDDDLVEINPKRIVEPSNA
ncbi:hypothetical protein [Vibrio anguillarum]|uniref:hypothetical protein n=1 Tax=Vibrio anguillarum TaxID=55601 RepID=UPI0012FE5FC6|nr:hypothetical protein [Vibrio anguillarum]